MATVKVIFLALSVLDADTGATLYEADEQQASYVTIESCRREAVQRAHSLTARYRAHGYDNAFTNVYCGWRNGIPIEPA